MNNTNGAQRLFVVGRHEVDFGEQSSKYEVVAQENVSFTEAECKAQLTALLDRAAKANAALVFQAIPGFAAIKLAEMAEDRALVNAYGAHSVYEPLRQDVRIGVISSVPGERPQSAEKEVSFWSQPQMAGWAGDLVKFSNPNAKLSYPNGETLKLTVDPPMRHEFSHITWMG